MNGVDLFCGAGGLSLGLKNAGFNIISAYDNWEPAVKTYEQNFPNHRVKNLDISEVLGENNYDIDYLKHRNIDIIFGGPPCQDFSQAGKKNQDGKCGNLTPVFAKVVAILKPTWVLMENVNTILTIGKKRIQECVNILRKAGYGLTEEVLNANNFGVPQNRKRLFLLGKLHSKDNEIALLLSSYKKSITTVRDYFPEIASGENATEYYYRHPFTYARRAIFSIDEPSPTIRGVNRPIPKTYQFHKGDKCKDRNKIRPLTLQERAIIQTFPMDFKFMGKTKTNNEQLVGNAVPPLLAEWIGKRILSFNPNGKKISSKKATQLSLSSFYTK